MNRRDFIRSGSLIGVLVCSDWSYAKSDARPRKILVLLPMPILDKEFDLSRRYFTESLMKRGLRDGENIKLEFTSVGYEADEIRKNIKQIATLEPDVIICRSTMVTTVVSGDIKSIPIIFVQVSDPVGIGLVGSMQNPGGNVTGFSNLEPGMGGKWLQMLKEIAPRVVNVRYMNNHASGAIHGDIERSMSAKARAYRIGLTSSDVGSAQEIKVFFERVRDLADAGIIIAPGGFTLNHRGLIVDLANHYAIPAVYPFRYFVDVGGLASYGPEVHDAFQQAANYVDKVLNGVKPGDLPVQGPTKLYFTLNIATAKAMNLALAPSVLAQADDLIE